MRVMGVVRDLVLALILAAASALPGMAAERAALVIGNSAYRTITQLANPGNDAEDMANALQRIGYAVTLVRDGDLAAMNDGLRAFLRNADRADSAVVFYSGHGVQVNGRNYLIPVNASIADELDLDTQALSLDKLLDLVDRAGPKVRIVILDSCRDNPLTRNLVRGGGTRGLARIDVASASAKGTLIAFSTAPGSVAQDGNGRNSPFTKALLDHIATPGLDVRVLFGQVRADVDAATQGAQTPWVNEAIVGSFAMAGGAPAGAVQVVATPPVQVAPQTVVTPQFGTGEANVPPQNGQFADAQQPVKAIAPVASLTPPSAPPNPSFPCGGRLNDVERTICSSTTLADLDRAMAGAYSSGWNALSGAPRKRFAEIQLRWIGERNACGADAACLDARYRERVASLGLAASGFPALAVGGSPGGGPSFRCDGRLNQTEARVCSNPGLAALDRRMAAAYGQYVAALVPADRKRLAADQRRWAGLRDMCQTDDNCIAARYVERLQALGVN